MNYTQIVEQTRAVSAPFNASKKEKERLFVWHDIEEVVSEAYHQEDAGRPPRKPIGIFKALIMKRVKQIPSDRELYRCLWYDKDLKEVCDSEAEQKPNIKKLI